MIKRLIYILIFLLPLLTLPQSSEIASFEGDKLTAREFKLRFELTPRIQTTTLIDSQKIHFLYTLLAEKLWAKEARSLGLDTSAVYQQYILNLEKMLVRDVLFKQEISSKVKITEEEIVEGMNKRKQELFFKFLYSKSKIEIDSLHEQLAFVPLDSLLIGRVENLEQQEPISVVYGQLEKDIEQLVYKLQPGEYTPPVEQDIGWVIYYMTGRRVLDESITGNIESIRSSALDVIERRALQNKIKEYLTILLQNKNVTTDGPLFGDLCKKLFDYLNKKYLDEASSYILYEDDLLNIMTSFSRDQLESDFIKFEKDPISLREFILYLYFKSFITNTKDFNSVSSSLNYMVKEFIRSEILSREAYSRNLQMLTEVQSELKMWGDNFLSQYLRNQFNKQARVTETELEELLSNSADSLIITDLVSLIEIKLESLDQAQNIFSQLQYNYNFDEVIENLNINPALIIKNEEPQPIGSFGKLSQIISQMREGEVYGPIKKDAGYSIIKLEKRVQKSLTDLEKNNAQLDIKKDELFFKKLSQILTDETIKLAQKYSLVVDDSLLKNIPVTEIPTMIYRYYGFGGQTAAAPFTYLFYQWFEKYEKQKEAL
jgi:parvulin-like peptidyl-prolyl isomerase